MLVTLLGYIIEFIETRPFISFGILIVLISCYNFIILPLFLSPLRNIPGPYINRITCFPSYNKQRKFEWIQAVLDLHSKYGNIVILGPKEISVNGKSKFINDIYVKNFPKSKFYENFRNHGFKDNIFASLENDRHLKYKKMIMNLYSKSAIFSKNNATRMTLVKKVGQLIDQVYKSSVTGIEPDYINAKSEANELGKGHKLNSGSWFNLAGKMQNLGIDVYSLFGSLAMDVVSAFELGSENGCDLLSSPEKRHIIATHRLQASMSFWTTLMPRFWNWAAGPKIIKASEEIEKWQMSLYHHAEDNVPNCKPNQNKTTLEALKSNGFEGTSAYSFLSDNIFAGHETTAIQLTYLTYELSRPINKALRERLTKELTDEFGKPESPESIIDDLERVDGLPFLNALIEENSRVHTSIPGSEPRVVEESYKISLDDNQDVVLPKGTIISCLPYALHRNPKVFPIPSAFIPERWLPSENESNESYKHRIRNQQRFMMPFGKGIRMCLGMHLAVIEMKLSIANLYWHFNSKLCEDWCKITPYASDATIANSIKLGKSHIGKNETDEEMMVMQDSYTTSPLNDECWLEWYKNY